MNIIELTQGYFTVVDAQDYDKCIALGNWTALICRRADGSVRNIYAKHRVKSPKGIWKDILLHRFILDLKDPKIKVDHKDHNGLNNKRENLREATDAQNCRNARRRIDNLSGFKGVSWSKMHKQWRVRITKDGKEIFIGLFKDINDATQAYKAAADNYHGNFACTKDTL